MILPYNGKIKSKQPFRLCPTPSQRNISVIAATLAYRVGIHKDFPIRKKKVYPYLERIGYRNYPPNFFKLNYRVKDFTCRPDS